MVLRASASSRKLLVHAFVPSAISLAIGLLIGLSIVAAHILTLSARGVAFPNSSNDIFMLFYANNIIQPIATALNNTALNNGLTIALWGLIGLGVQAAIAGVMNVTSRWRQTEQDITMPRQGVVVRHPLERTVLTRAAWRMGIIVLAIAFTITMLPAIRWCLNNDWRIMVHIDHLSEVLRIGALTIGVWTLVLHGYVILLRLYLFRTRVFEELLY